MDWKATSVAIPLGECFGLRVRWSLQYQWSRWWRSWRSPLSQIGLEWAGWQLTWNDILILNIEFIKVVSITLEFICKDVLDFEGFEGSKDFSHFTVLTVYNGTFAGSIRTNDHIQRWTRMTFDVSKLHEVFQFQWNNASMIESYFFGHYDLIRGFPFLPSSVRREVSFLTVLESWESWQKWAKLSADLFYFRGKFELSSHE